jgi:hypothetical protein
MLLQILQFLIISGICFVWGAPVLLLLNRNVSADRLWFNSWSSFLPFLFLSGCLLLSILASWLQLFVPMKFGYLLLLTAVTATATFLLAPKRLSALLPAGAHPRKAPFTGIGLFFFILCLIVFLLLSCLKTSSGDTRIYHLQIVSWAMHYRTVPGLANLFPRFGLGSNWFNLIAWFHLFNTGSFSYLNGTLAIWFFIWLVARWQYHWQKASASAASRALCLFYFLVIAYSLLDWELFRDTSNSTDYDTIVTACYFLAIDFLLQILLEPAPPIPAAHEWGPDHGSRSSRLFILITLAAIGFKLSGLFILILLAWYLFRRLTWQNFLFTTFAAFFVIAPVLARNYITTGYLLFPLPIGTGHPDWQLPAGMANLLRNYITLSNRMYNQDFTNSYAFAREHAHWIPGWFHSILPQHKVIMLLTLASTSLFVLKPRVPFDLRRLRTLLALLLIVAASWFFLAPSPRFGFGVLLFTAFLPLSFFLGPKIPPSWYRYGFALGSICVLMYLPGKVRMAAETPLFWLTPAPVDKPRYTTVVIRNITYLLPDKADTHIRLIGFLPLPCIGDINPYLAPRGASLKDGFYFYNSPDSTFIANYNY